MNTRVKGNKNELRAQKELENDGWIVQRAGYRRFQQNDFFGIFDILAVRPGFSLLVQVKSNYCQPEVRFKVKKFQEEFPQFVCQVWVWKDRKGWVVYD